MVRKKVKKSFAEYEGKTDSGKYKRDCWSDKNKLIPRDICYASHKKYWFDCDVCGHEFESAAAKVACTGRWCPYCCNQKLCDKEHCKHCYNKSFSSFEGKTSSGKFKRDCWSNKNENKPRNVFIRSGIKHWFNCDICGHEFHIRLACITEQKQRGKWCPYCSSQKMCSSEILCYSCHNKSFASYDGNTLSGKKKVDCWSDKNELTPRDVAIQSAKKCWFDCDICGYEFDSTLGHIVGEGTWCPNCKNKTELKLLNWLKNCDFIISFKKEYSPEWCSTKYLKYNVKKNSIDKGKYQYRFDFFVTIRGKKNIIIELDGQQHYEQVMSWKSPLCQQVRDKYKEMKAKQNSISVIRILQQDVWLDKNNWKKKLEDQIKTYMEV